MWFQLYIEHSQKYITSPTVMIPDTYEYPTTYSASPGKIDPNNFQQTYCSSSAPP